MPLFDASQVNLAAPGAIGGATPGAGSFTVLSATGKAAADLVQVASYTTGTLPSASANPRTIAFNNTLNRLVVSNGTSWDAIGTLKAIGFQASVNSLPAFGSSFTRIPLGSVGIDTESGWNATTNRYTIPFTGKWLVSAALRPNDQSSLRNWGFGAHSIEGDGYWCQWQNTATGVSYNRNGSNQTRLESYTVGDLISLFAYCDGATFTTASGSLSLVYLGL